MIEMKMCERKKETDRQTDRQTDRRENMKRKKRMALRERHLSSSQRMSSKDDVYWERGGEGGGGEGGGGRAVGCAN